MKLTKKIYEQIISCPQVPPETGGILGISGGEIVNHFSFDGGLPNNNGGTYIPDIVSLNRKIEKWAEKGIQFCGLVHTHASQWPNLSNDDRIYIANILHAMPAKIKSLYFPLILPSHNLKGYIAIKKNGVVNIIDDVIEVIT